ILLQERRATAERIARVRKAQAQLATVAARQAERDSWATELDAARRADTVIGFAADLDRHIAQLVRTDEERERALSRCMEVGVADPEDDPAALRTRAGQARDEAGQLVSVVAEAEQQCRDRQRLSELAGTVERRTAQLTEIEEKLTGLPERLQQ